jgi:TetR/AcrR family transcriptional regulator, transcriptional repressor for nem operon
VSKREALVEAAKSLLWERGFHAMSPRDVLRRSRAGQGSLYHFFSGKEELAAEAMAMVAEEVSRRIELTCGPATGSGFERLGRFLISDRDALRGCRLGRMAQDPDLPASLRSSVAGAFERLRSVLEEAVHDAQREGDLRTDLDASALADCIIAVVQGGYVLARAHGENEHMARVTGAMSTVLKLLRPVQNEPVAARSPSRRQPRSTKAATRRNDGKPKPRIRKTT